MAHLITHSAAVDFLNTNNSLSSLNELLGQVHVQMDELTISEHSELNGASIGTVEISGRGTFIIVALRRADGEMVIHPAQNVFLNTGDTLIVMGHRGDLPQFARRLAQPKSKRLYRGARF